MQFKHKVAVITGAASGIGKALAAKCLEEGMKVMLADIDKNKLDKCEDELKKTNKTNISAIASVITDVAKEADIINLANQTTKKFGAVNFLFNNAGIAGAITALWSQPTQDIEQVLQVNLMGTIYGIKNFVPIMLKQQDECFIINTSAGAGFLAGEGLSAYKASKHAITAISEVLFADLKQINANIHVAVLIPHWVNTDMPTSIKTTDAKVIEDHRNHLKNFGMLPALVAEKVFAGIKEKIFYIFTHPDDHLPRIKQRMEGILTLSGP